MLALLARWLRAAGYDTALARPGTADASILAQCIDEDRVLISRDRSLVGTSRERIAAVLLASDRLEGHARELTRTIGIDWTFAPFTRCMADNRLLRAATTEELANVPEFFRESPIDVRACPECRRIYWPGGHVRRMRAQLELWRTKP